MINEQPRFCSGFQKFTVPHASTQRKCVINFEGNGRQGETRAIVSVRFLRLDYHLPRKHRAEWIPAGLLSTTNRWDRYHCKASAHISTANNDVIHSPFCCRHVLWRWRTIQMPLSGRSDWKRMRAVRNSKRFRRAENVFFVFRLCPNAIFVRPKTSACLRHTATDDHHNDNIVSSPRVLKTRRATRVPTWQIGVRPLYIFLPTIPDTGWTVFLGPTPDLANQNGFDRLLSIPQIDLHRVNARATAVHVLRSNRSDKLLNRLNLKKKT